MRRNPDGLNAPLENVKGLVLSAISNFAQASNVQALAALEHALYRSDRPITDELRHKMLAATAEQMTALQQSLEQLKEQDDRWRDLAPRLEQQWPSAPFETKSMLREMVIEIDKTQSLIDKLTSEDYSYLVAAMPPKKREAFLFGRDLYKRMANALRPLVKSDKELSSKPTSMQVWNEAKRLFPSFEDALTRPLDSSKYVDRDLRKTPRKSTK